MIRFAHYVEFREPHGKEASVISWDAIHEAGLRRFRPIIPITVTIAGGLISSSSSGPRVQSPMKMLISLGFGVMFGDLDYPSSRSLSLHYL